MVISLGILTRQWGRQESTYLYSICNVTVVTFNFDRKVIIPTGKFDIHEVQLKNIPVKNDSGVSNNSHRKITMDTTNRLQSPAFQECTVFSLFHFPPILGHLLFNHIIIRGKHQNHLKWPSLSSLRTLLFLFLTHPSSQLLKIPPSSGKSSTIKCKIGKSIVEYQLYIFFKVEMFKEVGVG